MYMSGTSVTVRIPERDADNFVDPRPGAVMHDDFEARESSRHPSDRRGVIQRKVRRRRASHQKNRRLPILQGFVDRPEQWIVERPRGFTKSRLEIDRLQFEPANSALRLVHRAPAKPFWIDRADADKFAMARDKRVDLIIVVADRRRVAANDYGRDKAASRISAI
jgi:hypothetical protein